MKHLCFLLCSVILLNAGPLEYIGRFVHPVQDSIKAGREARIRSEAELTRQIRESYPPKESFSLRATSEGIVLPDSPETCKPYFHFPPANQGLTSACWAYAGISFMESELYRQQKKTIKLSVMAIVYQEYLEKARYHIQTRGMSDFTEGSQIASVFHIAEQYGLLPEDVYPGNPGAQGHDHELLHRELESCLAFLKAQNIWDENTAETAVRAILDRHLGPLPEQFSYKGRKYTPQSFFRNVIQFDSRQYVDIQSTLRFPFDSYAEFPYPDNWKRSAHYYNIPLERFYQAITDAVKTGFSVPIGGDTTEPGYLPFEDIAFIPDADIPPAQIDQYAREYRMANRSTGDDHALHIVGFTQIGGVDWFLIKDSWHNAYAGKHPGYFFCRGDYIKLKMLGAVVPAKFVKTE
ncbi:MAG: C1 family peptidase [Candidatus Neomarinimicrobiota bacterium]|jgi:bleomycin hydrolase